MADEIIINNELFDEEIVIDNDLNDFEYDFDNVVLTNYDLPTTDVVEDNNDTAVTSQGVYRYASPKLTPIVVDNKTSEYKVEYPNLTLKSITNNSNSGSLLTLLQDGIIALSTSGVSENQLLGRSVIISPDHLQMHILRDGNTITTFEIATQEWVDTQVQEITDTEIDEIFGVINNS